MNKHTYAVVLFALALLVGCAHGGGSGTIPVTPQLLNSGDQTLSGVVHGNFTEYAMPAGARPVDIAQGPYDTQWFTSNTATFGGGYHVYRFSDSNGSVGTFTKGPPWAVVTDPLTVNGLIYFISLNTMGPGQNPEFLSNANYAGVLTVGSEIASDEQIGDLTLGPDGRIWYPDCIEVCGNTFEPDGFVVSVTPGAGTRRLVLPNFVANRLSGGPGGHIYATASYTTAVSTPPPNDSAVFVISTTSDTILKKVLLPHGSTPTGIVTGADHNLWITEPGINKIARMTPLGVVTQFSLPTANASPSRITYGFDNALWFTETKANKIGRITTSGSIREFVIPTAHSGPTGILDCSTKWCPPHGGVWFAESSVNKIAKFRSPL